jgi:hypothetical protein
MPKHPKTGEKRPADLNQLAGLIVGRSTQPQNVLASASDPKKRKAGQAGAAARTSVLSPAKRKEIAKKGAEARWKKPS